MSLIGIDARKIEDYGIGSYIRHLLEPPCPHELAVCLPPGQEAPHGHSTVPVAAGKYSLRELLAFRPLAKSLGADLFHFPHYVTPLGLPCPVVTTIHDVIHLLRPQDLPGPHAALYAKAMLGRALAVSRVVITGSERTRADLLDRFSVPPERIRVIPYGADERFRPGDGPDEATRTRVAPNLAEGRGYLLYAGAMAPRKNVPNLLRAFHRACDKGLDLDLVCVGERPGQYPEVAKVVYQHGYPERLHFPGRIALEDLAALYRGAVAVVAPSRYEGFGLPALEAMQSGAPVIASTGGAQPEVVGEAALLFEAEDIDGLTASLLRLDDAALLRELRAKGLERAAGFSWERSRQATFALYDEALG